MHETPSLSDPLHTDSQARQELRMVGSERASEIESARSQRLAAHADRGDAIREIAANLERLCIEYDCYGRVSPQGSERRATWAQFKAQIEALRRMA